MKRKPTIAELEKLLNSPDGGKVRLLPNGKVKINTPKETIEETLIAHSEKVGELTRKNKILRNALVHCLGHLQTKIETNADMLTLKKIEEALSATT